MIDPIDNTRDGAEHWFKIAMRPDIRNRSAKVAMIVGTILGIINHGDTLFSGSIDGVLLAKLAITYLVPFSVSTWASVQTALYDKSHLL